MKRFIGIAATGLLALVACKDQRQRMQGESPVKAEQKQAEDSFKQAEDAQKKASKESEQATTAQKDVEKAREGLSEKEQKALKEQGEAQQAQANAAGEGQKAQQEGAAAQQRAQQALTAEQQQAAQKTAQQATAQQQAAQPTTAQQQPAAGAQDTSGQMTTEISGRLARATSNEVQLEDHNQPLRVGSDTTVTLDGQTSTASQLPAGSEVRASYRVESGEAHAIRIEARSSQGAAPAKPQ